MKSLDEAIGTAIESTVSTAAPAKRGPGRPPKAKLIVAPVTSESQQKVGAPAVVVQRSGHRVRLRNIDHALEGCVSGDGKEIRYRLEPNRWTTVPDAVYEQLKSKFYDTREVEVPNWEVGGDNEAAKRTPRMERQTEYYIEFPDEAYAE